MKPSDLKAIEELLAFIEHRTPVALQVGISAIRLLSSEHKRYEEALMRIAGIKMEAAFKSSAIACTALKGK